MNKPLESPSSSETLEAPSPLNPSRRSKATREPSLLELCKDFDPILYDTSRSADKARVYARTKRLSLRRQVNRLPIKKIKRKVSKLRKRYPDLGYYAEKTKIGRTTFWKIGRKTRGQRDIALYYSTSRGRFYVSESDVRRNKRLASKVVMYRLSGLGVPYSLSLVREKRLPSE